MGTDLLNVPEGSPDEEPTVFPSEAPSHQVCITQSYWMDQSEVTNAAFDAFVKAGGYSQQNLWSAEGWAWLQSQPIKGPNNADCGPGFDAPQQPRVCVNYYESEAYAKWRGGILPTEAQWEYAARGTESRIYPWGNTWDPTKASTRLVGFGTLTPVCSYPTGKSWVGACDMTGNAWEWVSDWYSSIYYEQQIKDDPTGPSSNRWC